ncbi:LysR family transcriptional regulator [Bacillus sp. V3B]|uniref:helix-turn-helix domain-containing protein n=1 Tax=Bacillus sp. V3B TaxID=2804915 RepID=UPI00210D7CBF|nr:LysR family transcriptional regulator [Bacillus sp. V3B]MCQ6277531.1 LysR family transcriptional regulator [Bacillus sp. V3B]
MIKGDLIWSVPWNSQNIKAQKLIISKFLEIAKVAEKLHVSHSAISQAISSLESELDITIFNRSRSGSKCKSWPLPFVENQLKFISYSL